MVSSGRGRAGGWGGAARVVWLGVVCVLLTAGGAVAANKNAAPAKGAAAAPAKAGAAAPAKTDASGETVFKVDGKAAILADVDTGTVLFEQDADQRLEPASLTKVMTLYLVYEAMASGRLKLDEMLPVSERAWRLEGSKTFVKVGDRVKVEDLILGIAVQSGNDACLVMAEHLGGSESGFAQMMNAKAKALGLTGSHFVNASGLPDENHYTTARDMFRLAQALLRDFPQFAHFVQKKEYTFNGITQYNRNRLLWKDPSIIGMKTGHTNSAGYCLIAANEKEGQRLVAVIMGAASVKVREEESLRLLRYGNRNFEMVRLFQEGHKVRTLRVWKGKQDEVVGIMAQPLQVTLPRKEKEKLEVGFTYQEPIEAPLQQGATLGSVVVRVGDKELLRRPVVAATAVEEGGFFSVLVDSVRLKVGM